MDGPEDGVRAADNVMRRDWLTTIAKRRFDSDSWIVRHAR